MQLVGADHVDGVGPTQWGAPLLAAAWNQVATPSFLVRPAGTLQVARLRVYGGVHVLSSASAWGGASWNCGLELEAGCPLLVCCPRAWLGRPPPRSALPGLVSASSIELADTTFLDGTFRPSRPDYLPAGLLSALEYSAIGGLQADGPTVVFARNVSFDVGWMVAGDYAGSTASSVLVQADGLQFPGGGRAPRNAIVLEPAALLECAPCSGSFGVVVGLPRWGPQGVPPAADPCGQFCRRSNGEEAEHFVTAGLMNATAAAAGWTVCSTACVDTMHA